MKLIEVARSPKPANRRSRNYVYCDTPRCHGHRVSVYCKCGAQWHGGVTVDNPVIEQHRHRCGEPISENAFRFLGHHVKFPQRWKREDAAVRDAAATPGDR